MARKLGRVQRLLERAQQQQTAQKAHVSAKIKTRDELAKNLRYAPWRQDSQTISRDFAKHAQAQLRRHSEDLKTRAYALDENIRTLHKRKTRIAALRKRALTNATRDAMRAADKED